MLLVLVLFIIRALLLTAAILSSAANPGLLFLVSASVFECASGWDSEAPDLAWDEQPTGALVADFNNAPRVRICRVPHSGDGSGYDAIDFMIFHS